MDTQEFVGIVRGSLWADRVYQDGEEFRTTDEKLFQELRGLHAVVLPAETLPAEVLQQRQDEAQAEVLALRQRVAELEAAQAAQAVATPAPSSQSGQSSKSGK